MTGWYHTLLAGMNTLALALQVHPTNLADSAISPPSPSCSPTLLRLGIDAPNLADSAICHFTSQHAHHTSWYMCHSGESFPSPLTRQVTASISSLLSAIGSGFILYIVQGRGLLTRTDVYVLFLCILDLGASVAFSFGRAFVPAVGDVPSGVCLLQAVSIQFFGIASILWVGYLSAAVVISLRPSSQPLGAAPDRRTLVPLVVVIAISGVLCATLLGLGSFGNASLWCWVTEGKFQLTFYYLPLLLSWCVCIESLRRVSQEATRRSGAATRDDGSSVEVVQQMARLVFVFVVFYFFGLMNRVVHLVLKETWCDADEGGGSGEPCQPPVVVPLLWLHVAMVPLQGFGNAVVYGDLSEVRASGSGMGCDARSVWTVGCDA